jgi:hypothetical protein
LTFDTPVARRKRISIPEAGFQMDGAAK